jgi:hypothetical protein
MAADDSKLRARRGSHDLAGLRTSIVRLPDSRPKSGRTPDKLQAARGDRRVGHRRPGVPAGDTVAAVLCVRRDLYLHTRSYRWRFAISSAYLAWWCSHRGSANAAIRSWHPGSANAAI